MRSKKLVIVGGLLVLLLVFGSMVTGCSSAGNKANPLEDINAGDKKENVSPGGDTKTFINPGGKKEPGSGTININGEEFSVSDIPGFPEGRPAADGIVRKVTGTTLDLEGPTGERSLVEGGKFKDTETKITQIIFNSDTRVYKQVPRIGQRPPIELKESSINDISEGQQISVWGDESGSGRILATVIITM